MKQLQSLRALRFKVLVIAMATGFILIGLILYVSVHLAALSKVVGLYTIQLNQLSVLLLYLLRVGRSSSRETDQQQVVKQDASIDDDGSYQRGLVAC